jgi:hypothetical protein
VFVFNKMSPSDCEEFKRNQVSAALDQFFPQFSTTGEFSLEYTSDTSTEYFTRNVRSAEKHVSFFVLPVDSDSYNPIENFKDNAQQLFHHILSMKKKPFARQIPEKDWYKAAIV